MRHWKFVLALLSVAVAVPARGQKAKEAATPEEAIKFLTEASRAGDVTAFAAQMVKPYREIYKRLEELEKLYTEYDAALDQKFGKDPKVPPRTTIKDTLKTLKSMEVTGKTEKAKGVWVLKVKSMTSQGGVDMTQEGEYVALKEGDGWKVAPAYRGLTVDDKVLQTFEKHSQDQEKQFTAGKAATERVIKDVKAGKLKNRQEAFQALTQPPAPAPQKDDGKHKKDK